MEDGPELDTDYPELTSATPAVHSRTYKQRTWSGSLDRLVEVQQLVQDNLKKSYADALAAAKLDELGKYQAASRLEELKQAHQLVVRVVGRTEWEQRGDLSKVLSTRDVADVKAVHFSNNQSIYSGRQSQVAVRLRDEQFSKAVEVEVSGTNATWVTGLHSQLSETLARGKPNWSALRSAWTAGIACFFFCCGVMLTISSFWFPTGGTSIFLLAIVYLAFVVGVNWAGQDLLARLLPGFEIVRPGERSAGSRHVGGLLSLLGVVITAVVIPIVLAAAGLT